MRFCTSCGAQLNDGDAFCTSCGASVGASEGQPAQNVGEQAQSNETRVVVEDYGYDNEPMGQPMGASTVESYSVDPGPVGSGMPRTGTVMAQDMNMGMGAPVPPGNMGFDVNAGTGPTAYRTQTQTSAGGGGGKGLYVIIGVAAAVIVAAIAILVVLFAGDGCAKEARADVTVEFETYGGSSVADKTVKVGEQVKTPTDPIRDGYTFDGWYSDPNYSNKVTFPITAEKDTILYAKWVEKSDGASGGGGGTSGGGNNDGNNSGGAQNTGSKETVSLSVTGADGSVRSADIHRDRSSQRVFPDSNTRRLSESEVAALSDAERCIAWNEIIASSNGYAFKNGGLANYFSKCSWYKRNAGANAGGDLTAAGSANVELLKRYTDGWWMSLATY